MSKCFLLLFYKRQQALLCEEIAVLGLLFFMSVKSDMTQNNSKAQQHFLITTCSKLWSHSKEMQFGIDPFFPLHAAFRYNSEFVNISFIWGYDKSNTTTVLPTRHRYNILNLARRPARTADSWLAQERDIAAPGINERIRCWIVIISLTGRNIQGRGSSGFFVNQVNICVKMPQQRNWDKRTGEVVSSAFNSAIKIKKKTL